MTDFRNFNPGTEREHLAAGIAEDLDDFQNLPLYLFLTRKYPTEFLRDMLSRAMGIPAEKIRKSRAALFFYLIRKYDNKGENNNRDQPRQ